jgi:hypothetical protein
MTRVNTVSDPAGASSRRVRLRIAPDGETRRGGRRLIYPPLARRPCRSRGDRVDRAAASPSATSVSSWCPLRPDPEAPIASPLRCASSPPDRRRRDRRRPRRRTGPWPRDGPGREDAAFTHPHSPAPRDRRDRMQCRVGTLRGLDGSRPRTSTGSDSFAPVRRAGPLPPRSAVRSGSPRQFRSAPQPEGTVVPCAAAEARIAGAANIRPKSPSARPSRSIFQRGSRIRGSVAAVSG